MFVLLLATNKIERARGNHVAFSGSAKVITQGVLTWDFQKMGAPRGRRHFFRVAEGEITELAAAAGIIDLHVRVSEHLETAGSCF